jgi:hypothetical protein
VGVQPAEPDNGLAYPYTTDRYYLLATNSSRATSFGCQQDIAERRVKFRKFVIKVTPSKIQIRVFTEVGPGRVAPVLQ